MKTLFSILLFFTVSLSFAQLTTQTGPSGGSSSGLTDAQYAAMGTNNGCRDGEQTANSSNWSYTYHSIVDNTAINIHYREAYGEAFMSCRNTAQNGDPVGGGSTCTNWNWTTMSFETGPCGTGEAGNVPNGGDGEE